MENIFYKLDLEQCKLISSGKEQCFKHNEKETGNYLKEHFKEVGSFSTQG
jgi:hypothetical protein